MDCKFTMKHVLNPCEPTADDLKNNYPFKLEILKIVDSLVKTDIPKNVDSPVNLDNLKYEGSLAISRFAS